MTKEQTPLAEVLRDISRDLALVQDRMKQGPLSIQDAGLLSCVISQATSIFDDLAKADGQQKLTVYTDLGTGIGHPVLGSNDMVSNPLKELLGRQGLGISQEPIEGYFGDMFPKLELYSVEIDSLIIKNDDQEPQYHHMSGDPLETALAFNPETKEIHPIFMAPPINELMTSPAYELMIVQDLDKPRDKYREDAQTEAVRFTQSLLKQQPAEPIFQGGDVIDMSLDWPGSSQD